MSNILVLLVMFCFSCSIAFAETEKFSAKEEAEFQAMKRKEEKRQRFAERIWREQGKEITNNSRQWYIDRKLPVPKIIDEGWRMHNGLPVSPEPPIAAPNPKFSPPPTDQ
jgi:hypothetical protein